MPTTMRLSVRKPLRGVLVALTLTAAYAASAQPGYYPPPSHYPPPPTSYRHSEARSCDYYAREEAYRYAPSGAGLHGAAHGAVKGAVFGAIVGGGKGARRGAAVGGGLGAVASGARARRDRDYAYHYAYEDCIRGFRR